MPYFPPQGGGGSDLQLGPLDTNASPGTVVTANNVVYVRKTGGSDSNTGANLAEGFQHVSYAYTVINALGGGTIYAEDGALANSVTGTGVLLAGTFDTGSGGSGWTTLGASTGINLVIIPVAGGQYSAAQGVLAPKGGTWLTPMLWLSGVNYGNLTFTNWNMSMPSGSIPSLRAGISSPLPVYAGGTTYTADAQVSYGGQSYLSLVNGNVGHQPDISPSQWTSTLRPDNLGVSFCQGVQFVNCSVQNIGHDVGPAADFGFTFWFWWTQCVFSHAVPNSVGSDVQLNSAMRYIASPSVALGFCANYLHQFRDCRIAGGGIYSSGTTSLNIEHMLAESMNFPGWYAEAGPNGNAQGTLVDFNQTDSTETRTLINKGVSPILVKDCGPCDGPVIVEAANGIDAMASYQSGAGVMGTTAFLEHDGARMLFGPSAAPYPNIARDPNLYSSGTTAGPDGRSDSAYVLNGNYQIYGPTPAVGDVTAVGMWVKSAVVDGYAFRLSNMSAGTITLTTNAQGSTTLTPTLTTGFYTTLFDGRPWRANEWVWMSGWVKTEAFTGSPALNIQFLVGSGVSVSRPWVINVPATDNIPLSQVKRWCRHASPTPATWDVSHNPVTPTAGSASFWPGQKLGFWDDFDNTWKYLDIHNGAVRVT